MVDNSQSPATKQDIFLVMQEIGKLYDANERWKNEIIDAAGEWKDDMLHKMDTWKNETKQHFDLVAENLKYDFLGAHKDRIENHEDRIRRLERKVRL